MNFNSVFYPKSIAIIGASTKPKSVGNDIVKNLVEQGYQGKIYPINPKATDLYGVQCYPSVTAVEGDVEFVVLAIPAEFVPSTLEECGKKGVKGAVVISAGFKEVGRNDLEDQLKEICAKYDITMVGPNCLGLINAEIKMNASFAVKMPAAGNVAFISQSGALCTAVLDYAEYLGIGFSKFVSMGNKAVVSELELIKYLANDPNTKVIGMYIEQLQHASEFIKEIKQITRGSNPKPIIAIKSGRTSAGASASASHTGALSGDDKLYESLFKQCGIIRANSVSELFDLAMAFSDNPLPSGDRVAILTNAGGPGVLTTDEAIDNGLQLAKLADSTVEKLKSFLPAAANFHNPVDMLGDAKADRYTETLKVVLEDSNVDSVLVILTPQSMTEIEATAKGIVELRNQFSKPILVSFMGQETVKPGVEIMMAGNVTDMEFPEPAARALANMYKFEAWSKETDSEEKQFSDVNTAFCKDFFDKARARNQFAFPEAEAMEVLKAYNFPTLEKFVVTNVEEAKQAAAKINKKMVFKIVSKDILHKSDVGGVMLGVEPKDAETAFNQIMDVVAKKRPDAKLDGVLMVEMASNDGCDFILGVNKDSSLGHTIMVGMGGIYVEVFKDVSFGIAPLSRSDIEKMLARTKAYKIIEGARGQAVLDKEALIDCIMRVSKLVTDFPEIKELDINPLRIMPAGNGVKALDGRIIIE